MCGCVCVRERERESERVRTSERERERQRETQTDRQTDNTVFPLHTSWLSPCQHGEASSCFDLCICLCLWCMLTTCVCVLEGRCLCVSECVYVCVSLWTCALYSVHATKMMCLSVLCLRGGFWVPQPETECAAEPYWSGKTLDVQQISTFKCQPLTWGTKDKIHKRGSHEGHITTALQPSHEGHITTALQPSHEDQRTTALQPSHEI